MIGGKWKLIILQILICRETERFSEWRTLERDGLVTRKVCAQGPPRVEYTVTQRAMDLTPMFKAMHGG